MPRSSWTARPRKETAETQRILDAARTAESDGLQVELGGDAARVAEQESGAAEGAGMLAALVILGILFGSVVAARLPVIIAVFAVGSSLGVIMPRMPTPSPATPPP